MRIGLCYDLRAEYLQMGYLAEETAEFDREETITSLEDALAICGYQPQRIGNLYSLVECLAKGERWPLVFNICEGLFGFGREASVPALLEAYRMPYTFSDPLTLSVTLHKPTAKQIVAAGGVPTPAFRVVAEERDLYTGQWTFPLFVKPVAEGTGKGIYESSHVCTFDELATACHSILSRFSQPALVETFLDGTEVTVGICGTGNNARSMGVMEIVSRDGERLHAYTYTNKEEYESCVSYRLVRGAFARRAEETALRLLLFWSHSLHEGPLRYLLDRDASRLSETACRYHAFAARRSQNE